jgi:hypothetical protein
MRLMNSFLMVVLLTPLGACSNRVVSETPWFKQAASTGPRFRDGLWRSENPRCKTSEAEPAERWPTCAGWAYLRGNQSLSPMWDEEGTGRHRHRTYQNWSASHNMIVAGDPLISQSTDCPLARKIEVVDEAIATNRQETPPSSDPAVADTPTHAIFCYDAARATAFDAEGRITAVETWPVFCGPWPRKGGNVTDRPWPGLSLVGENCTATSEAALREAAKQSHDVALSVHFIARAHWVRDGYH